MGDVGSQDRQGPLRPLAVFAPEAGDFKARVGILVASQPRGPPALGPQPPAPTLQLGQGGSSLQNFWRLGPFPSGPICGRDQTIFSNPTRPWQKRCPRGKVQVSQIFGDLNPSPRARFLARSGGVAENSLKTATKRARWEGSKFPKHSTLSVGVSGRARRRAALRPAEACRSPA